MMRSTEEMTMAITGGRRAWTGQLPVMRHESSIQ